MIRVDPISDPPGMVISGRGPLTRQVVRDHLKGLDLVYTEAGGVWGFQFFVSLPKGRDTGGIREWLRNRGRGRA